MKRAVRLGFLCALSLSLLTVFALADFGPKPLLTVRVENAPEELYYLDLLAEGEHDGSSPDSGLEGSYSQEEIAALDEDLLDALRSAVPEGWRACLAEGTGGAPVWGDLEGSPAGGQGERVHRFRYVGLPETYRVILVTKSGERWVSEPQTRTVLQSSVTVDWADRSLSAPPAWAGYGLQLLATLVPTLVLEGLALLVFGFSWRRNWRPFLLVNLVTQGALALYFSLLALRSGVGPWYFLLLIPAEAVIALAEGFLYKRLLTGQSKGRAFAYGLTANVCSAVLGVFLAEPVWRFVVSIS